MTRYGHKSTRIKDRKPIKGRIELEVKKEPGLILAPCGVCADCEAKKRMDWAFRMKWETLDHKFSWFVLLTYDDENCPWYDIETEQIIRGKNLVLTRDLGYVQRAVHKPDIQKFIKRLRARQEYYFNKGLCGNDEIRYFCVSEYGENKSKRPHYHLVIWGMDPFIKEHLKMNKIWKKGMVSVRPLKSDSTAGFMYLTKYLYKQKQLKNKYVPPFSLMSKRPYIGNRFERYVGSYMKRNNTNLLPDIQEKPQFIPKIYQDKLAPIKQEIAKKQARKKLDTREELLINQFKLKRKNYFKKKMEISNDRQINYQKEVNLLKTQQ